MIGWVWGVSTQVKWHTIVLVVDGIPLLWCKIDFHRSDDPSIASKSILRSHTHIIHYSLPMCKRMMYCLISGALSRIVNEQFAYINLKDAQLHKRIIEAGLRLCLWKAFDKEVDRALLPQHLKACNLVKMPLFMQWVRSMHFYYLRAIWRDVY